MASDAHNTDQRPPLRAYLLWFCVLLLIPMIVVFRGKQQDAPLPKFIPLGTNAVTIGMSFFDPHTLRPLGTAVETDTAYEFEDGTNRPGVLMKSSTGIEVWTPRETLSKALVHAAPQ